METKKCLEQIAHEQERVLTLLWNFSVHQELLEEEMANELY